jgi:hypothetical protein
MLYPIELRVLFAVFIGIIDVLSFGPKMQVTPSMTPASNPKRKTHGQ